MNDVRQPMSREEINEMLRQQERDLPLQQVQPAADPDDERERRLRHEWRRKQRERRERRERQQEPEGSWEGWERWLSVRVEAAIAAERAAYQEGRKAFAREIESVVGEAVAQLLRSLRNDLDRQLNDVVGKVTELEGLWKTSLNTSAAEIADLQRELTRLLNAHNAIRRDLALPTITIAN